jgi:hypothetical protein
LCASQFKLSCSSARVPEFGMLWRLARNGDSWSICPSRFSLSLLGVAFYSKVLHLLACPVWESLFVTPSCSLADENIRSMPKSECRALGTADVTGGGEVRSLSKYRRNLLVTSYVTSPHHWMVRDFCIGDRWRAVV